MTFDYCRVCLKVTLTLIGVGLYAAVSDCVPVSVGFHGLNFGSLGSSKHIRVFLVPQLRDRPIYVAGGSFSSCVPRWALAVGLSPRSLATSCWFPFCRYLALFGMGEGEGMRLFRPRV